MIHTASRPRWSALPNSNIGIYLLTLHSVSQHTFPCRCAHLSSAARFPSLLGTDLPAVLRCPEGLR